MNITYNRLKCNMFFQNINKRYFVYFIFYNLSPYHNIAITHGGLQRNIWLLTIIVNDLTNFCFRLFQEPYTVAPERPKTKFLMSLTIESFTDHYFVCKNSFIPQNLQPFPQILTRKSLRNLTRRFYLSCPYRFDRDPRCLFP